MEKRKNGILKKNLKISIKKNTIFGETKNKLEGSVAEAVAFIIVASLDVASLLTAKIDHSCATLRGCGGKFIQALCYCGHAQPFVLLPNSNTFGAPSGGQENSIFQI